MERTVLSVAFGVGSDFRGLEDFGRPCAGLFVAPPELRDRRAKRQGDGQAAARAQRLGEAQPTSLYFAGFSDRSFPARASRRVAGSRGCNTREIGRASCRERV